MFFLLRKFIPYTFISVILEENNNIVKLQKYRNHKLIKNIEKTFDNENKACNFIKEMTKNSLFYYTSLFLNSAEQGLVPSNDTADFERFGVGKISIKNIPLNNAQLYTATEHIEHYSELFENCGGLDFIFSPLSLLYFCSQKESTESKTITLYAYRQSSILAILICKGKDILFGNLKIFEHNIQLDTHTDEGFEQAESDFSLENFNEELDNKIDSLDNNSISIELEELDHFSGDMDICRYIISNIETFYNDEKYNNSFINNFIFFTTENITQTALEFIENETFLEPQVKHINTLDIMIELTQKEIRNDI